MIDTTKMTPEEIEELKEERSVTPSDKLSSYRVDFLKENQPELYAKLIREDKLREHLWDVRDRVYERKNEIVADLKKSAEWDKVCASGDFTEKVRLAYQYDAVAEEMVLNEIIYVEMEDE